MCYMVEQVASNLKPETLFQQHPWGLRDYMHVYKAFNIPEYMLPLRLFCDSKGIGINAGRKWVQQGRVPAQRFGGWWFVDTRP